MARIGYLQWSAITVLVVCITLIAIHPFPPILSHGQLELTVLDVGQGDSLFMATPDGHTILIDGGGGTGPIKIRGVRARFDVGEEVVSRYLWSRGLKRLDAVALTHAHEDHLEGLFAVLQNFRVAELWVGHDVASANYQRLLQVARDRGTRIVHLEAGNTFAWGNVHGTVLWPNTDSEVRSASNDDSLVLRVEYGTQSLLLAGDIEKPVERALVDEGIPIASAFLKVPHHGSSTSSTPPFLTHVRPSYGAISVGENNPFNHPTAATLERLRAAVQLVTSLSRRILLAVTRQNFPSCFHLRNPHKYFRAVSDFRMRGKRKRIRERRRRRINSAALQQSAQHRSFFRRLRLENHDKGFAVSGFGRLRHGLVSSMIHPKQNLFRRRVSERRNLSIELAQQPHSENQ
jgi:beta-lactamase superfamily II metal-dependent hydrolase